MMFDVLLEICIIMISRIYKAYTRSIILTDFFCLNLIFPDEVLHLIRQKPSQTKYPLLR